jgi:putative transposase
MPGRPRGLRTAAEAHRQAFVPSYNTPHRHSGLHTAADVHHGTARAIQASRARVLPAAYSTHPERFVRKSPVPPALPATSWINPPQEKEDAAQ